SSGPPPFLSFRARPLSGSPPHRPSTRQPSGKRQPSRRGGDDTSSCGAMPRWTASGGGRGQPRGLATRARPARGGPSCPPASRCSGAWTTTPSRPSPAAEAWRRLGFRQEDGEHHGRGSVVAGGPIDLPVPDGRRRRYPEILHCAFVPPFFTSLPIRSMACLRRHPFTRRVGSVVGVPVARCVPGGQKLCGDKDDANRHLVGADGHACGGWQRPTYGPIELLPICGDLSMRWLG
ncbi:unnamed protein product, partial [Urochloa humidicola]